MLVEDDDDDDGGGIIDAFTQGGGGSRKPPWPRPIVALGLAAAGFFYTKKKYTSG